MKVGKAKEVKSTMPFGKYKDVEITDLPDNYLEWLSEQEWFEEKNSFLYKLVTDEITTREEEGSYFPDQDYDYPETDSIMDYIED